MDIIYCRHAALTRGEKRMLLEAEALSIETDDDSAIGCAYMLENGAAVLPGGVRFCDAALQPGSAYCARHHTLCHLRRGSAAEERQLREIEALATAVGGKQGRATPRPPPGLLRRLIEIERSFLRPSRSRNVREASMAHRNRSGQSAVDPAGPSKERIQHGPVERVGRTIADTAGRPSRPYRAVDTLAIMERRGSITGSMRQAGEDFRARFAVAQLDPLRALDLSHLRLGERSPRPDRDGPGLRIEAARTAVWRAIQAVGGIASPAGSCLWHVLGWERSVQEWALHQGWSGRHVSQEAASGILIATLGALEAHFGPKRTLSN
jgi:hypothetical protein